MSRTTETFEDIGLRREAGEALDSFLASAARVNLSTDPLAAFGLRGEVRKAVHEEAAEILPGLVASLLGAALTGAGPADLRSLGSRAADARDRLNEAASSGRVSYARGRLRPAMLGLASYLGGYDKTAAQGRLPGSPADWRHVSARIRDDMESVARVQRQLGAEAPAPAVRAARGPLEALLGRAKSTFDGSSETVRRLALAPPPRSVEEAQDAWRDLAEACAPPLSLAKALERRLTERATEEEQRTAA